jgi:hypothetical protein
MTQEEKELLVRDLCARLPYGVVVNYKENQYDYHKWKIIKLCSLSYSRSGHLIKTDIDGWIGYDEYDGCGMSTATRPFVLGEDIPFLRPLSSMTEEEKNELRGILYFGHPSDDYDNYSHRGIEIKKCLYDNEDKSEYDFEDFELLEEFLFKNHFDFRGLIKKGLALEAPEGMYK